MECVQSKSIVIPAPNINHFLAYPLEATPHCPSLVEVFQHLPFFSLKLFVTEVGESLTPNTSKHKEDNIAPLSLLSLPGGIIEVLQLVMMRGELDLDKLDPNQVNMLETWVLVETREQIRLANSAEAEDRVID